MKLLFDQNLSFKLCQSVADIFPGSSQVRLLGLEEADDRVIWEYAKSNGFLLVSVDADFAELAARLWSAERMGLLHHVRRHKVLQGRAGVSPIFLTVCARAGLIFVLHKHFRPLPIRPVLAAGRKCLCRTNLCAIITRSCEKSGLVPADVSEGR
jgi:Domain of unknown function (DUF5615)